MATVYIPSLLQKVTGGLRQVEVAGATVREIIDNLERIHPGMRESLLEDNRLRSNISVAIDGEVSPLGLLEKVGASSEVHFVAAIKGGHAPSLRRNAPSLTPAGRKTSEEQAAGTYTRQYLK